MESYTHLSIHNFEQLSNTSIPFLDEFYRAISTNKDEVI